MDPFFEANLNLWNEWTSIHEKSEAYDLPGFLAGKNSLHSLELAELGPSIVPDENGAKRLLHLQCHFGLDTLSWARLGAKATGIDFSDKAIQLARSLNERLGLDVEFICSSLYDLPDRLDTEFDIVYTSYGILAWLPDISKWAEIVSHFLKPGGIFYIAELHPFACVFDDEEQTELKVRYPYFSRADPLEFQPQGSYVDRNAKIVQPVEYEWTHSLGEIITALISAGLRIEYLHEFPYTVDPFCSHLMEKGEDRYWRLKDKRDSVPLMYSIKAIRQK